MSNIEFEWEGFMLKSFPKDLNLFQYLIHVCTYIDRSIEFIQIEFERAGLARVRLVYKFELDFELEFGSFINRASP